MEMNRKTVIDATAVFDHPLESLPQRIGRLKQPENQTLNTRLDTVSVRYLSRMQPEVVRQDKDRVNARVSPIIIPIKSSISPLSISEGLWRLRGIVTESPFLLMMG